MTILILIFRACPLGGAVINNKIFQYSASIHGALQEYNSNNNSKILIIN